MRKTGQFRKTSISRLDKLFTNISSALARADAELADIVRVRCFIGDTEYVVPMSKKLHQYLGAIRPANTTVVRQLAAGVL